MKRLIIFLPFILTAAIGLSGCKAVKDEAAASQTKNISGITINTSVRNTGQYPENFVITFESDIKDPKLDPTMFSLTGKAGYWGSGKTRDFECTFESVSANGNTLTLVPADFPEKFFYVKEYLVTCKDHPEYSFSNSDVTNIVTPVADDFKTFTNSDGITFDYHLFTPDETEKKPIVIVFHGYGDTNNLLTYRTSVEWAEPENQKVRPCYVLSPVIDDHTYFDTDGRDRIYTTIKGILDDMISKGNVDPDRIYVMGNSMGGVATIEFCEKYPETVSAAMALCPAISYAPNIKENLNKMREVPIWFAHAANDNTVPVSDSRTAVSDLEELGAKEVKFTEYTDEQMNSAGADNAPDSTYSYHHVELAVMEDDTYQEWLFDHKKER